MSLLPTSNRPWYQDIFGTGSNVFGAGTDSSTDALEKAGLLNKEDLEKAHRKSIMQGLLGTAISYISQPKNQGYGSALPYLGKAFSVGMEQANKPFDSLTNVANMNMKMQDYTDKQTARQRKIDAQALQDQLYTTDADGNPVVNTEAMNKLKVLYPEVYAQYIDIEHKASEIDLNKAKSASEIAVDADIKDIDLSLVTPESRKLYLSPIVDGKQNPFYLDKRVLDYDTKERSLENREKLVNIAKERFDVYQKLGQAGLDKFDASLKQQGIDLDAVKSVAVGTTQPMDGTPRKPEKGFVAMEGSIPNSPNNVTLSTGDVVTPIMYNTMMPPAEKFKMTTEMSSVKTANDTNIRNIDKQIDAINRFLNMNGTSLVTGRVDRNTPAFFDQRISDAKALLNTIVQKEFLKNYSDVKATGGGFGSLSEKEGQRLEEMGFNLDNNMSKELLEQNLRKLLSDLQGSRQNLSDGFLQNYGMSTAKTQTFDVTPLLPKDQWDYNNALNKDQNSSSSSNLSTYDQRQKNILDEANSLLNL